MSDELRKGFILPSSGSLILPDAAIDIMIRNEERMEELRALAPGLEKQAIALNMGTTLGFAEAAQMVKERYLRMAGGLVSIGDWIRTQAERRVYMTLEPDLDTATRNIIAVLKEATRA